MWHLTHSSTLWVVISFSEHAHAPKEYRFRYTVARAHAHVAASGLGAMSSFTKVAAPRTHEKARFANFMLRSSTWYAMRNYVLQMAHGPKEAARAHPYPQILVLEGN